MSELKAMTVLNVQQMGCYDNALVYFKSEADKVIAEKDAELRHHKYKRCLDVSRWCESEENRLEAMSPILDTDKEYWEYNSDYWAKWHKRWLELAEKFKEVK